MTLRRADHGFTLAETLIALWVVSMAMGCVLAGFALLSRFDHDVQKQAATRHAADSVVASLRQAVSTGEALSVTAFSGDAHELQYACEAAGGRDNPKLCTLKSRDDWRFRYVSQSRVFNEWPRSNVLAAPQPLEALILQDQAGTTLGVVRIHTEQARDCQFDTVSRTCRAEPK